MIVVAALLLLAFAAGFVREGSGDFHWHVVLGDWSRQHLAIYRNDTLSYTLHGQPMFVTSWLGDVLLSALFRTGGYPLCYVVRGVCIAATVGVTLREMVRRGASVAASAAILALLLAHSVFELYLRPEMFSFVALAVVLHLLGEHERSGRRVLLVAILGTIVLWANVHGSVAIGLLAVGLYAAEAAVRAWAEGRRRDGWIALALPVAAFVASCVSPEGWNTALAFRILSAGCNDQREWAPLTLTMMSPILFVGGVVVVVTTVAAGRRVSIWRACLVLALAILVARHRRFVTSALIAAAPLLAGNIASIRQRLERASRRPDLVGASAATGAVVAALWAVYTLVFDQRFLREIGLGPEPGVYPDRACAYARDLDVEGGLLNSFNFGSYLTFCLEGRAPVAIDQRACSLYPGPFYRHYVHSASDPDEVRALADEIGATWAFVGHDAWSRSMSSDRHTWALVYFDDLALVYVRADDPRTRSALTAAFRVLDVERPELLARARGDLARTAEREVERLTGQCPRCRETALARAALAVASRDDAAFERARAAIDPLEARRPLVFFEAQRAADRGAPREAAELFARYAELGGDPVVAAIAGAEQLMLAGEAAGARRLIDEARKRHAADPSPAETLVVPTEPARRP